MATTTELTEKYISEHISIKECLKNGIINYSALSRLIAKELIIEKKTSKDAILVAARRFKEKIKNQSSEKDIVKLLRNGNIEIKNNIVIYILEKNIYPDSLIDIEKQIKKEKSLFFSIEGTKTITIIIQKQHIAIIDKKFKNNLIKKTEGLSLITITTSPAIEHIPGVINHISSLFFEKGINIEEFISCYEDTLIVIDSKEIDKAIKSLSF